MGKGFLRSAFFFSPRSLSPNPVGCGEKFFETSPPNFWRIIIFLSSSFLFFLLPSYDPPLELEIMQVLWDF